MTIPLDRLYHYIESIAQNIRGDDVIIYRFYPHGSKKIEDLTKFKNTYSPLMCMLHPHLYCNDQEPLNFDYYQSVGTYMHPDSGKKKLWKLLGLEIINTNLRAATSIYDKVLLLHSEHRSVEVKKYRADKFIPVYYWCHALLARDWFRYAEHISQEKNVTATFLIYNRAWAGTREYRLKFVDLLVSENLHHLCKTSFNPVDPDTKEHYKNYKLTHDDYLPDFDLENYFPYNTISSSASADFELDDYNSSLIEVVLETLFSDTRLHLTEKILRPIAIGQPFILAGTHGSLEYLKSYGFKTFESIWDESYDKIEDPLQRLRAIINLMKTVSTWSDEEKANKIILMNQITNFNKNYFFSTEFFNLVINELKNNLDIGLQKLEKTNTSSIIDWRKLLALNPVAKQVIIGEHPDFKGLSRQDYVKILSKARQYYLRS